MRTITGNTTTDKTWEMRLKDLNMTTKELQVAIGTPSREIVRRWLQREAVPSRAHQEQIEAIEKGGMNV